MGCGSFSSDSYASYSRSAGKHYDHTTGRVSGQEFHSTKMDSQLNPENVIRECCNTDEHPNTIPVILALDVTGSMGAACKETAEALGSMMSDLYKKYKDIQIMVMGIGDLDYDRAPIQISQFESDVRIAKWLDKIWMEHGGGGNSFESYTAAWYMGLKHTKLDSFDKQGRKGIIITMGDEPLNPYLPAKELNKVTGDNNQADIETGKLYEDASKKFDIFHIEVDHGYCFDREIKETFGKVLGQRLLKSSVNGISKAICDCIDASLSTGTVNEPFVTPFTSSDNVSEATAANEISW